MTPAATETEQGPSALLAALRSSAGSLVDGAQAGSWDDAPSTDGLSASRSAAVLAAWTGARLHAGLPGLLEATDADVGLLVGDWCYAHSLQALAHAGDLPAIGLLATAIGDCAIVLADAHGAPADAAERVRAIWTAVTEGLRAT